jgi:hypothetical protein
MKTGPRGAERGAETHAETSDVAHTRIRTRKKDGVGKPECPFEIGIWIGRAA